MLKGLSIISRVASIIVMASLRGLCPKQSSAVAASGCYRGALFFWIASPSARNDEQPGLLRLRLAMTESY